MEKGRYLHTAEGHEGGAVVSAQGGVGHGGGRQFNMAEWGMEERWKANTAEWGMEERR